MSRTDNVADFAEAIVEGPGGMNDYERHELVVWAYPERVEAVIWAMKCLANPHCEGSSEMLEAIQERRTKLEGSGE
jgi:hypothetical protein